MSQSELARRIDSAAVYIMGQTEDPHGLRMWNATIEDRVGSGVLSLNAERGYDATFMSNDLDGEGKAYREYYHFLKGGVVILAMQARLLPSELLSVDKMAEQFALNSRSDGSVAVQGLFNLLQQGAR